ncbi:hypothetical protein MNBD_GAMMA23-2476 [hydrothermal vent metagenome]|uniref:Proline rich signal peptide protein n=1 Tax=hydrothermal vent metagenome TaxID=652676 RepID=A0A3B0ZXG5_9ZZZZ
MAFTIAYSKKNNPAHQASCFITMLRLIIMVVFFFLGTTNTLYAENKQNKTTYTANEPGFSIQSLETLMQDRVYLLTANLNYHFSSEAIEALEHGVPLLILVDIEIRSPRWWWSDTTIAELEQGYLLLYHALSESYVVHNLNSGTQNNFIRLAQALSFLSTIKNLPILDANLLDPKKEYYLRVRTHLDIESLPAPMRPLAYISSDWQLSSGWYEWPLQK